MYPEDSAPVSSMAAYVPAFVCAVASVALMRSGFLSFLFLVPLGYTAAAYNPATGWLAFVSAAILNGGLSLGLSLRYRTGGAGLDILYYTVTALGFTWIMAGGTGSKGGIVPRIRTMYRFIAVAAAGALTFICAAYAARDGEGVTALIRGQAEWLASVYVASSGADAARRSFLERTVTPEKVAEIITAVALRGGALASAFFLLAVNRQAALGMARAFHRRRGGNSLSAFHVPFNAVWVLSLALAAIPLARSAGAAIPEIAAWNILVLCAILFLAQGLGIALFTLGRRPVPPPLRLLGTILVVAALFSPGINAIALGFCILLGIAENWLPLRAPKRDGPASTPGL
jgi:hypothetical protein